MKVITTKQMVIVSLSTLELWYLSRFFAPGLIFGISDPFENLDAEKVQMFEEEIKQNLLKEGILRASGTNQYLIDEMIGGMVYSCIHSKDMLVVKDQIYGQVVYYHFLPQWQLALSNTGDECLLTLFKDRSDLFEHAVNPGMLENTSVGYKESEFTVGERDLELAMSLYENGKHVQAGQILLDNGIHLEMDLDDFFQNYLSPQKAYIFDNYYSRDDSTRINQRRYLLLQLGHSLFWVTRDFAGETAKPILRFQPIHPGEARERFLKMLPKN